MNYPKLMARLAGEEYAALSHAAALALYTTPSIVRTRQRFGSYRTLAGFLTDVEFATVQAAIAAMSAQSPRVAAMAVMLALPGDESGAGGGIDWGTQGTRDMIDAAVAAGALTAELGAKLKAIGEETISPAEEDGNPDVTEGVIETARAI